MPDPRRTAVAVVTFIALIISISLLVALPRLMANETYNLFLVAPVQVVLGSLAFLAGVTAIVAVFARLGLADNSKALALPDGSVRALIALVLLMIFVIFANIIFGQLTNRGPEEREFTGLTATQVAGLPEVFSQVQDGTVDGTPTFRGKYLRPEDERATELGQQIVTALITLVTAISAFYFGSGSVNAAVAAVTRVQSDGTVVVDPSAVSAEGEPPPDPGPRRAGRRTSPPE